MILAYAPTSSDRFFIFISGCFVHAKTKGVQTSVCRFCYLKTAGAS